MPGYAVSAKRIRITENAYQIFPDWARSVSLLRFITFRILLLDIKHPLEYVVYGSGHVCVAGCSVCL